MDVRLNTNLSPSITRPQWSFGRSEWAVLAYWGIATVLGIVFLSDWIVAWNVQETLAHPWLIALLVAAWIFSQVLYVLVARHNGRPIHWGPAVLFALGNGVCEILAFALVYRAGELLGRLLVGAVLPSGASIAGFVLGVVLFSIYGGFIHALFWIKLLPPHLDDSPRSRAIRRIRPLAELSLVISWSLCFWLTQDIWTVIFFHTIIDFALMLRVRPPLFMHDQAA